MSMTQPFNHRLRSEIDSKNSRLVLGLDLDPDRKSKLHGGGLVSLKTAAREIVAATADQVCAYKLNFAFFERFGSAGWQWLEELSQFIGDKALIIGDAKRGDIGNSASNYAHAILNNLNMDAATVNPYMGRDSLEPFISDPAKGAFVLALTSNPGANDFQFITENVPLHRRVARWAQSLNRHDNLGLVVGATHPEYLDNIRADAPDLPLLIPGVGAQGGSLAPAVNAGTPAAPTIINVSRGALYAGDGALEDIVDAVAFYNNKIRELE
ncbi:MAG: orotidine-5'-phosphate decarboxylase [Candidatus Marinimicrobia bacterium]|nr:orotidine-5'-phosphate decarboxylase [Candidatus Neomarinimicrobiota bacterium]